MKILALHSAKGGVGKTSAAVNLALLAAKSGLRVLLVDLDPQGSASYIFRMKPVKDFSCKDLLKGTSRIERGVRGSDFEGLDLLPSALSFRKLDLLIGKDREALKEALAAFEGSFDLTVLDCPPGLSALAEAVHFAADLTLCPLTPSPLSASSFKKLLELVAKRGLDRSKVRPFVSMLDARRALQKREAETLKKACHGLLKTRIPSSSEVERMSVERAPLCAAPGKSKAAAAFQELWDEARAALEI